MSDAQPPIVLLPRSNQPSAVKRTHHRYLACAARWIGLQFVRSGGRDDAFTRPDVRSALAAAGQETRKAACLVLDETIGPGRGSLIVDAAGRAADAVAALRECLLHWTWSLPTPARALYGGGGGKTDTTSVDILLWACWSCEVLNADASQVCKNCRASRGGRQATPGGAVEEDGNGSPRDDDDDDAGDGGAVAAGGVSEGWGDDDEI